MSDNNWSRIKEIVDEAFRREPEERQNFVIEACAGNDSIRGEVESLLSSLERADGFMAAPAFEAATKPITTLIPGQKLDHYEILRRLGEGGMGIVYLGRDTKLDRLVAIKVLNKRYERHEENVRRFVREAKSASALNHPNILTIFEIGEVEGSHYIVSEYIEGTTLREIMNGGQMDLRMIVDVASQIANALAAAHKARIVHRDLKPENVIVREDGYVKVLDFGLAKLLPENASGILATELTRKQNTTASGMILGTVNYMSPEQAKGKRVDQRTDIFSLGVVLYEMITGKTPFEGDSIPETFANLIGREPEPLASFVSGTSDDLQLIVSKTLAKDPGERYANAGDLLSDLRLLHRSGGEDFLHRYQPTGGVMLRDARTEAIARSSQPVNIETIQQTSDAPKYERGGRLPRAGPMLLAALILGLASIGGLIAWSIFRQNDGSSQKITTVAVLPFKPIDSGSRDESLEMGVTETLITRLSSIGQLTVRPLNSVKKYAETDADPVAAGQETKADAVLTGSLQKAGDRLRVNARLLDVKSGDTLWSDKFDETFTDIFKVQDAIAERTANALRLQLSASEKERLNRRYTESPEAYQLYLQARNLYHRRLGNWAEQSMDLYTRALEKDPNFGLAHVALADMLIDRHGLAKITYEEMMPRVKEHLAKVFERDNALAEAYSTSAAVKYQYEYDWTGAEKDFQRAIELDPGSSKVHLDYTFFLMDQGRFDEAFAQLGKAHEIEPDSLTIRAVRGNLLWHARRDDEAIKYLEDFTNVVPDRAATYFTLSFLYRGKGRDSDAVSALLRGHQLRARPQDEINRIAEAYRREGWNGVDRLQLTNLIERSNTQRVRPIDLAGSYAMAGDKDNAFKYIEKAIEEHDPLIVQVKVGPEYDGVRDDPRFAQLLQKINLQP